MKNSFCPLYFVPMSPVCFAVVLGVLAFDLGFFKYMYIEDITSRVVEWSKLSRLEFNARLNEWYNTDDL